MKNVDDLIRFKASQFIIVTFNANIPKTLKKKIVR